MRRSFRRSFFYGADPILFALNAVAMFCSGWAVLGRSHLGLIIATCAWVMSACAAVVAVGGFLAKWQGRRRG